MDLAQVLLLTLAVPATYLLLYVLLRLENLLPDTVPPPGHQALAAVPAASDRPGAAVIGDGAGDRVAWTIPIPVGDRAA